MLNNINDLFTKYKETFNYKKDIEAKTIFFFKDKFDLDLTDKNLKINIKNKSIQIINIPSSLRFFLENKVKEKIKEDFLNKFNFNLFF